MEIWKCRKIVEFQKKIKLEWKIKKEVHEAQTASIPKEITPLPPDKILQRLWKVFLTIHAEIYRYTQTFAFKVLQECSSSMSRNGAVFSDTNQNMFAGKFLKWERFLAMF